MNPVGLVLLILFTLFLVFKLELIKWFNEWVTLYVVLFMILISENWKWIVFILAYISLWLFVFLNAESRFPY